MFIGHNAVGFASKRVATRVSLGWLMAAPMFLDLVWPVLLLLGIEHVALRHAPATKFETLDFTDYPWSHSLVGACVLGVLFAAAYWLTSRNGRGAVVLFFGVVSHWVFDLFTHLPDLPLYPGGPKVGLGLWNSTAGTVVVEIALFVIGLAIYLRTTRSRDRTGTIALWALVILLVLLYVASLFGPPPQRTSDIGRVSLSLWIVPFWAAWIDRHREVRV